MKDLFERQRAFLRAVGHALPANSREQQKPLGIQWTMVHSFAVLLVASAQWPMTSFCIYHRDDLSLATAGLSIMFTNVLAVIKMSTFLCGKQKFFELMRTFTSMFEEMRDPFAKQVLHVENLKSTRLVRVYFMSTLCTGVYFMMTPIVRMLWSLLLSKDSFARELPMPMRFSFDFDSTPGYELAYVYTACVTFVVVLYSCAVDGIFLAFVINLRAHFRSLQNFIKKKRYLRNNKYVEDISTQQDIANLVCYHNILLRLSKEVCQIYKPVIFGQFLMTSLEVCLIVYQLVTHINEYMNLMIYGSFLCSIMLQLFIYCYGGEIIWNENYFHKSIMVGTAVQLSDWYNLSPRYRPMFLLMLLRSQRPVTIRAIFYVASLANFMMILKAAMSYITLIQSIE